MYLLAINLPLIAFIAVLVTALIFIGAIYFFIKSRRSLKQTIEENGLKKPSYPGRKEAAQRFERSTIVELEEQFARRRFEATQPVVREEPRRASSVHAAPEPEVGLVEDFKNTIAKQQRLLDTYLEKVEDLEKEHREELELQNNRLEKEIAKLHGVIEEKDAELEELAEQAKAGQRMAQRIEEAYQEFEQLQQKMASLEKQAGRANNLAIELEDTKQSYEQVLKELARKQEKLEEVMNENHRMRREMDDLEDKLSEANAQRQQLFKKVQFLTDLNNDMQSMSETNKKLQTEMRRIGELESMLNMMAEERDYLLKKKYDR